MLKNISVMISYRDFVVVFGENLQNVLTRKKKITAKGLIAIFISEIL